MLPRTASRLPSWSFSGAGFLVAYHLGAAQCLVDQKVSLQRVTGVSAGALAATALVTETVSDGMDVTLQVAARARAAGLGDALQPGFSLIGAVEQMLEPVVRSAIETDPGVLDRLRKRTLRIGLAKLSPVREYCYVEEFQSAEEVVASCLLSSYVPGVTARLVNDPAAQSARQTLQSMANRLQIRDGDVVQLRPNDFVGDGGLCEVFPYFDDETIIVTPLHASFTRHKSIRPTFVESSPIRWSDHAYLHWHPNNLKNLWRILRSSEDLEDRFAEGYDDTMAFLTNHSLQQVYNSTQAS